MTIWYAAPQNIAGGGTQHKIRYPVREVVRVDGRFPYRPGIVCPKPLRNYEAQIGLKVMEDQVDKVAPVPHNTLAKWRLEALASRAQSHFAHLRDPVAVMNCNLCITSPAGRLVIDWVLAVTSTNPTAPYPINRRAPTPTFRASGYPSKSSGESTTKVNPGYPQEFMGPNLTKSASNATTWSNLRSEMMCHDERSTLRASEPLLPDRDCITTNAWSQCYQSSLQPFLEDEEDEQILWPRGVSAYEYGGVAHAVKRMRFDVVPLNWDFLD